jgi:hypothetical protein
MYKERKGYVSSRRVLLWKAVWRFLKNLKIESP